MVMDLPSPQSVGREFVRQYYTMLHEAPEFLHRFYSHDSSFVHGGGDKAGDEKLPAVGQSEIFKRIASLNFQDCHAKIRQVDSQSCLNGSVVIQVIGELSNNGLPLRRFMQSFVLAPQTPKKYYVHNDIFCYQDEVFSDAANELETPPDESFEGVEEHRVMDGYKNNVDASSSFEQEQSTGVVEAISNDTSSSMDEQGKSQGEEEEEEGPVAEASENVEIENDVPASADVEEHVEEVVKENTHNGDVQEESQDEEQAVPSAPAPVPEEVPEENGEKPSEYSDSEQPVAQTVPQKPTWAAMASKKSVTGTPGFASKPQATIPPQPKPENNSPFPNPGAGNVPASLPQRAPRPIRPEMSGGDNGRSGFEGNDDAGRGIQQYPDNQQVFVGNLPHYTSDKEVKEFFEKFGPVLDMRINRKANNNLPNFGFVVFDSPETVQKVLSARPLFNGKHRVNVEEKKPREELVASRDSRPRSGGVRNTPAKFNGPAGPGVGRANDTTPLGTRGGGGRPGLSASGALAGNGRGFIRSSVSDEGKVTNQQQQQSTR